LLSQVILLLALRKVRFWGYGTPPQKPSSCS
jgi:hypothetical protein